jgi:hypothetical protein
MPILNEELSWSAVARTVTDASTGATVADMFQLQFGEPTRDLINPGTRLYKFHDFASPARSSDKASPISPWWSPSLPYKHDGGLREKLNIADLNGVSRREWARLTSAVKEDWNSLAYLFEMELNIPVYGWFGGFRGMSRVGDDPSKRDAAIEKKGGSMGLPGGGTQFYIPNLTLGMLASYSIRQTEKA